MKRKIARNQKTLKLPSVENTGVTPSSPVWPYINVDFCCLHTMVFSPVILYNKCFPSAFIKVTESGHVTFLQVNYLAKWPITIKNSFVISIGINKSLLALNLISLEWSLEGKSWVKMNEHLMALDYDSCKSTWRFSIDDGRQFQSRIDPRSFVLPLFRR